MVQYQYRISIWNSNITLHIMPIGMFVWFSLYFYSYTSCVPLSLSLNNHYLFIPFPLPFAILIVVIPSLFVHLILIINYEYKSLNWVGKYYHQINIYTITRSPTVEVLMCFPSFLKISNKLILEIPCLFPHIAIGPLRTHPPLSSFIIRVD